MNNVALPTDFSENSKNAVAYALNFYRAEETIFHFVHSYAPPAYRPDYIVESPGQIGLGDTYRMEALAKLQELKGSFEKFFDPNKHKCRLHATSKSLKDGLSKIVTSEAIDTVVMGTQGATGAKAIFLGTRTTEVLKIATCPVLVVPQDYKFQTPGDLAFITDFKRNFSADILAPLQHIVSTFHSNLRIMHINEEDRLDTIQQSNRNTLEAYLHNSEPTWHWMPYFSSKTASIKLFIEELNIAMLVMVRYEHSFVEKLLREPVIDKMSFSLKVPFMVIPFDD